MCGAQGVGGSLESQDGGDERLLGLYSVRGGLLGRVIHQEGSRAEGGRASVCARGQRRVRDGSAPLAARRGEHAACAVCSVRRVAPARAVQRAPRVRPPARLRIPVNFQFFISRISDALAMTVCYAGVARSRSESTSFVAFALNFPYFPSSSSCTPPRAPAT